LKDDDIKITNSKYIYKVCYVTLHTFKVTNMFINSENISCSYQLFRFYAGGNYAYK